MTKKYWYEIEFPRLDISKVVSAETAGRAKYKVWLSFSDAYPMTFGEFLKIIKCRKVGII